MIKWIGLAALPLLTLMPIGCRRGNNKNAKLEDVAANDEVARYMKAFEKKGEQPDGSKPVAPQQALALFRLPADLQINLVASEPEIAQPVFLNFDQRGRLWVVQYNQYPYPAGLKVTSIDNHDRVTFDKVPQPPPLGEKGADRITIFEDTDGDGHYDKSTDAISGLNIATSVALGRGKIWVLTPPYLVAYPDADGDGSPDGPPVVHLRGFGLEDTHAVANSLRWGPDGWLYGAQGSTTTANISSAASQNVSFSGQAIWRYHPETHVFEVFAEGGGNTFYVEIDRKGRIFSGDNGNVRGFYFKQGGYYTKNWGKHGALTNPYAFGHLPNMGLSGDNQRFTHAWLRYEGDNLPDRYRGAMIALNPLHGYVQLTDFVPNGSSFNNIDKERILQTSDRWFRPVDIKTGPDGAVYIADWYDSRLSHVDPRDTWDKSSGRIYRLSSPSGGEPVRPFDLGKLTGAELIPLLFHNNRWFREQALRQLGDRKDRSLLPALTRILTTDTGQNALEALWAINISGGFNDSIARTALLHHDAYVRMWAVRLLGDARTVSPAIGVLLADVAAHEPHPEVRSQLASSAKRLPAAIDIAIVRNLLLHYDDSADPDIPLLLWWAIESKAESDREKVVGLFADLRIWRRPTVKQTILGRLMQRYTMAGGDDNMLACARLLEKAPAKQDGLLLIAGLQEGLRGLAPAHMPLRLETALQPYRKEMDDGSPSLAIRQGGRKALHRAVTLIADPRENIGKRLAYIRVMGEINQPEVIPVLLRLLDNETSSPALLIASLQSLQHYEDPAIVRKVLEIYADKLRAAPDTREAALNLFASRATWAALFLENVGNGKKIHADDVPVAVAQKMAGLGDPVISRKIGALWPGTRLATSTEKNEKIAAVTRLLQTGKGDQAKGQLLFAGACGSCHRLFSNGGNIGPDLTGYDRSLSGDLLRNIIDPNASIREGYAYYHIVTTDGRHITGKITGRQGSVMKIQPLGSEEITLGPQQIKEMQPMAGSVMPEHLLDALTPQQLRDLFSYLTRPTDR